MPTEESYINERLDHLGIVAGVCQEIGLAAWLDAQDPSNRQQVSVGTATVAMILNGLGFSNRQLYLVPQYFANKPVEHLLGAGIKAEMRECRLSGSHLGLVVRPRSDETIRRDRRRCLVFRLARCMWTRPHSRSVERTAAQVSECRSQAREPRPWRHRPR